MPTVAGGGGMKIDPLSRASLSNWRELGNNRPLMPYLWHTQPLIALLMIVGFPLITIIGLVFSVSAWRKVQHFRPAILIALIHGLVVIAFFVNARYRFPLTPVLRCFADEVHLDVGAAA